MNLKLFPIIFFLLTSNKNNQVKFGFLIKQKVLEDLNKLTLIFTKRATKVLFCLAMTNIQDC